MNVNLWFARDEDNEIVGVLKSSNDNAYTCPICASKVIPKALESKKITPHFAHIDKEKCSSESMLHWWFKHEFIERGDTFTIISDEKHTYTCEDFKTEVTFNLESGVYRPDIVVETDCGNEIVFEIASSNKKQVKDYIDRWIELDKTVVEVDIKSLTNESDIKDFKALYYKGKCFNFYKRDGGYYNTIGKMKEEMLRNNSYDIRKVKQLDWFWESISKYSIDRIEEMYFCIESMIIEDIEVFYKIVKKLKCNNILNDIINYKIKILSCYLEDVQNLTNIIEKFNITIDNRITVDMKINFNNNYHSEHNCSFNFDSKTKTIAIFKEINKSIEFVHKSKSKYNYKKFYELLKSDSIARKVTNKIKRLFKEHGDFCLNRLSQKSFNGKYFDGKKQESVDYYYYVFSFYSKSTNEYLNIDYLNDYLYALESEELFDYLCKRVDDEVYKSEYKLLNPKCTDCKNNFHLSFSERYFYIEKDLNIPKRCKSCRQKRKQNK